jgi:hypothetical protein
MKSLIYCLGGMGDFRMGKRKRRRLRGFKEAQAAFTHSASIATLLFAAYAGRCAFTGEELGPAMTLDPTAVLLRLGARADEMLGDDAIPACPDAIFAFERGHLALGVRYEFLVALDRISPELLERLNPNGRLTLPDDPALRPHPHALAAHRADFAEGRFAD